MLRSIGSGLATLLLMLLLYVLLPLLLVGVAVLVLLGIGSLLARFVPLTTFEATLIVTLVAVPTIWGYWRFLNLSGFWGPPADVLEELEEEEEPPVFVPIPGSRMRSGRKRRKRS